MTSVKYEISTFDIGYMQNFVKTRKLILLGQNAKICAFGLEFSTNYKFEIITFKIGYKQNFVKIRKLILFVSKCRKLGIWARNLNNES